MARSLRIERENGLYHVINRVNYRWALGSREFKKDLLKSEGLLKDGDFEALRMEGRDLVEANELLWEELPSAAFGRLDKPLRPLASKRSRSCGKSGWLQK